MISWNNRHYVMLHTIKHGMLGELTAVLALAGSVPHGVREVHIERGGGRERKEKEREEWPIASRKILLKAPTLQFITKLVYRWKTFHRNG